VFFIHVPCFLMCILFYFSFIWLHLHASASNSMVHCGRAFKPGASGLPYYCKPPVCVPDVIDALAMWRQNTPKKESPTQMREAKNKKKTKKSWNLRTGTGHRGHHWSTLINYNSNLSVRDTFLSKLLPPPNMCVLLSTSKETYDLNLSKVNVLRENFVLLIVWILDYPPSPMCVFVRKRVYVRVPTCVELVGERTRECDWIYKFVYIYVSIYIYIHIYIYTLEQVRRLDLKQCAPTWKSVLTCNRGLTWKWKEFSNFTSALSWKSARPTPSWKSALT